MRGFKHDDIAVSTGGDAGDDVQCRSAHAPVLAWWGQFCQRCVGGFITPDGIVRNDFYGLREGHRRPGGSTAIVDSHSGVTGVSLEDVTSELRGWKERDRGARIGVGRRHAVTGGE